MKAVSGSYRLFEDAVHIDWPFFLHDLRRSGVTKLKGDLYNQGRVFNFNFGETAINVLDKVGISDVDGDGKQDLIVTSSLSGSIGTVRKLTFYDTSNGAQLLYQTQSSLLKVTPEGIVGSPSIGNIKTGSNFPGKEIVISTDDDIIRAIGSTGVYAWTFNASVVVGHNVRIGHTAIADVSPNAGNEVIFATRDISGQGATGAELFILNGNTGAVIQHPSIGNIGTTGPVSIADIKGDSHYEIVIPNVDGVRVFAWTGSSYALDHAFGEAGVVSGVLISDIYANNNDYQLVYATSSADVCPSGYSCQSMIYVVNATSYAQLQAAPTSNYVLVQPIAVNLDSDKQLELITIEKNETLATQNAHGALKRYDFTPGGSYTKTYAYPSSDRMSLSSTDPVSANIDDVGNYEIIYGKGGGDVIILSSTLSTTGYPQYSLGGTIAAAPAIGDWDNDGYAEIAVKRRSSSAESEPPEPYDPLMFPQNYTSPYEETVETAYIMYIDNLNFQPLLNPLQNQTGYADQLYTINPATIDPNNDALIIDYGYPFNSSGQFLPNASQAGTYDVFVSVSDGNLTDSQSFILNVFSNETQFENNLSNWLSTYQMNLTENVPQTVFLKIPKDANILHAEINIEGLANEL